MAEVSRCRLFLNGGMECADRQVRNAAASIMDAETLTYLLRGGHLNVPERKARGLWPHPPLSFAEVVRHLTKVLEEERWFPLEWQPAAPGESIGECGVIERQSPTRYVYRVQRHHPLDPTVLAEQTEKVFRSAEAAARFYLKWDLHLPGDLDGWKVVE
jgi:hypothetical protein